MENDQIPPVQPTTTVPPITTSPILPIQPKPSQLPIIFLSLLSLIFLSGMIYFYFQAQTLRQQTNLDEIIKPIASATTNPDPITPTPTPSPTSIFSITYDDTTKQNIYSNQTYNFSFQYPSNYEVLSEQEGGISGPWTGNPQDLITLADKNTGRPGTDAPFSAFAVTIASQDSKSFEKYMTNEVLTEKNSPRGIENEKINKTLAGDYQIAYIDSEAHIRRYFISTIDNKNVIVFSTATREQSFIKIMDRILSTFKFTN